MTTTDDYARDLALRALGRKRVREAMLKMHVRNNYKTHPPVFDPRCATCLRIIHGETATAGNTNGKAIEKGEPTMSEETKPVAPAPPRSVWLTKTALLAYGTILLGVLEQLQALPFLTPAVAGYITMAVGVLGFVIRLLTSGPVGIFKK